MQIRFHDGRMFIGNQQIAVFADQAAGIDMIQLQREIAALPAMKSVLAQRGKLETGRLQIDDEEAAQVLAERELLQQIGVNV